MPDDDKVTEQEETVEEKPVEETEEKPDIPSDEAAGFASKAEDADIEDGLEGLEQPEKETEAETEESEEGDEGEEELEEEPGDEDEDIERGKELQAEQEKADKERKVAAEAEKQRKTEAGAYDPFTETNDSERIEFMKGVLPPNMFPDTMTLEDGTELDFKGVFENEPEIPIMITTIVNNLVNQMIANDYLATTADIKDVNKGMDRRLFKRTVTNRHDGVPNADKIYQGDDFKKWIPDQPKEIRALLESDDPYDHIRVYKRFMNKSGVEEADKKVTDLDKKRKAKKEKFDSVHKTTVKSKNRRRKTVEDPAREEQEGFNSKEDDDDY